MTVEEIIIALEDRNLKVVSERTGVAHMTLSRISRNVAKKPAYDDIKRLSDYLSGNGDNG